jgi:integrase
MSRYKRNKTWHADFSVDGQRFRVSLETTDWREAQAKERQLIADAKAGKISPTKLPIARSTFREAAEEFLQDRLPRLAPLSVRTERERAKVISLKLGDIQVSRITPDTVRAYIRERKASGISNATVNRELDIFRGVLKKAKRWHLFADEIRPLPIRQSVGRALTHEEKVRLLNIATSRPEWQNAAWAAILALNTTMRGCEIRQLQWRDVDLIERALAVRKSKTEAGERVIPLNADAWDTVISLYKRAQALGDVRPDHYVFPACEAAHINPMRPITGWRTAWRSLTRAVQCPACGRLQNPSDACCNTNCKGQIKGITSPLSGLRFHDLRHHAITELAESQASDSTIMSIAGHVSPKMLQHYSHVRIQAKREALDALSTRWSAKRKPEGKPRGYVTNHVTTPKSNEEPPPQVAEKLVELVGIEPTTSSLRTMRSPS